MNKQKIIGTGLSGLVGSRVSELLDRKYEFKDLSLETGVDITRGDAVVEIIKNTEASIILHMAAITDVDGCEKEKDKGRDSLCWRVNVEGTRNIVQAAEKYNKKLIYISTDFVFNGEKDNYSEGYKPDPINWYGETKYEGEKIVQENLKNWIIVRPAFPYRAEFEREDVVRFFLNRLKRGKRVKAVDDWIITPTFIDDIALALDKLISSKVQGIYHVVGSSSHTPFEMASIMCDIFNLEKRLVDRIKLENLFTGKAKRPKKLVIDNGKIRGLSVRMKNLREGLIALRRQLNY